MLKKILFILLVSAISVKLFAYPPAEKKIGKVLIKAGTSSRDIMPFLEKIAANWGKYYASIYADYRENQIFIKLKGSARYLTFEEIKEASSCLTDEVMHTYPLCDASVIVFAHPQDRGWHKLEWVIKAGKIAGYEED